MVLRHVRVVCVTVSILAFTPLLAGADTGWRVAYDHLDSLFERSLSGTLEVAEGHLRFRAVNRQVAWDVALEDVIAIKTEEVTNPLRVRVRSIVIHSREGHKDVRRRIAPIDEQLQFLPPVVLAGVMKDRWKQTLTVLSSLRQN